MRDKNFYINAVKMDLMRVVTATGDTTKNIPKKSVDEFFNHALADLDKVKLTKNQQKLKRDLEDLQVKLNLISDPLQRLRWAEQVLTIRSLL
jgi:hypothetical protein